MRIRTQFEGSVNGHFIVAIVTVKTLWNNMLHQLKSQSENQLENPFVSELLRVMFRRMLLS